MINVCQHITFKQIGLVSIFLFLPRACYFGGPIVNFTSNQKWYVCLFNIFVYLGKGLEMVSSVGGSIMNFTSDQKWCVCRFNRFPVLLLERTRSVVGPTIHFIINQKWCFLSFPGNYHFCGGPIMNFNIMSWCLC